MIKVRIKAMFARLFKFAPPLWSGRCRGLFVLFVGPGDLHGSIGRSATTIGATTKNGRERGRGLASHAPKGPLRAGAARRALTDLSPGVSLAGYGERAFTPNTGVADPIYARALVVDNGERRLAFATVDLLLVIERWPPQSCFGLAQSNIVAAATGVLRRHSHAFGARRFAGGLVESIAIGPCRAELVEKFRGAHRRGDPCRRKRLGACGVERVIVETAGRPDRQPYRAERTSQPLARYARLSPATGIETDCIAARVRRPCDLSGVARPQRLGRLSRRALGGAGNVARVPCPVLRRRRRQHGACVARSARTVGAERGRGIGERAAIGLKSVEWKRDVELESIGATFPLPAPAVKLAAVFSFRRCLPASCAVNGLGAWSENRRSRFSRRPLRLQRQPAAELRACTTGTTTIVTSFNGDYVGYILPDRYYDLKKYEPSSMALYGHAAWFRLSSRLSQLAEALAR